MFSKKLKLTPQNSPRLDKITNENVCTFYSPTYGKPKGKMNKQFIEKSLKSAYNRQKLFNKELDDDQMEESEQNNISICLDKSELSISSISSQKKMVSFNFDSQSREGSMVSIKGSILKNSTKNLMSQIEPFRCSSPHSSSIKVLGSCASLTSLSSFKSGLGSPHPIDKVDKTKKMSSTQIQISIFLLNAEKYNYQVQAMQYKNQLFIDNIFHSSSTSLSYRSQDSRFKCIKWIRLSELFKDRKIVLFNPKTEERKKINLGLFQTKGLVGAMNKLKKMEGQLQHIFSENLTISKYGIYCLKLKIHGIEKVIIIDDNIPIIVQQNKKTSAFITIQQKNQVQIWPFLLQKAYAKVFNTYQSLMQQQTVEQWMSTILGHQVYQYDITDPVLRNVIMQQRCDSSYFFMTGQEQQLGKLEPIFQQQIRFNIRNQFRSLTQLASKYERVIICSQRLNYLSKFQSLKLTKKLNFDIFMYTFHLNHGANLDIGVWQKDIKYFRGIGYNYSSIRMMLVVKEQTGQGYRWIQSTYSQTKVAAIRTYIMSGQYILIFMIDWKNKPFQLNFKFSSDSLIQNITKVNQQDYNKILQQTACDIAQRFGICKQITDKVCIYKQIDDKLGILIENIHNQNNKIIASVRKGYKIISNNPQKLIGLTKNISKNSICEDIPPLKNIATMVIAKKLEDSYLFLEHK